MNAELDPELVSGLRALRLGNEHASTMLKSLAGKVPLANKFHFMMYFMEAFYLSIAQAQPILGWVGFGGELTDEQIDSFIDPVVCPSKSM